MWRTDGLDLDSEAMRELGYATAELDAPREHAENGSHLHRSRVSARARRRNLVPVYALAPDLLAGLCAKAPTEAAGEDQVAEQARLRRLLNFSVRIGDAPRSQCFFVDGPTQAAAADAASVATRAARGKAVSRKQREALLRGFRRTSSVKPEKAYLLRFIELLRSSAIAHHNAQHRPTRPDQLWRSEFAEPPEIMDRAAAIVNEMDRELSTWPAGHRRAEWLDARLTAYLMNRLGLGQRGAGGSNRLISEDSMLHLLSHPDRLIEELLRAPQGAARWAQTIQLLNREATPPEREQESLSRVAAKFVALVLRRAAAARPLSEAQYCCLPRLLQEVTGVPRERAWAFPFVARLRSAAFLTPALGGDRGSTGRGGAQRLP
jgi:hypothetical protein